MKRAEFDLRTLGRTPWLLLGVAFGLGALALVWSAARYSPATAAAVRDACLEQLLPLACAVASAGAVAGDPALELQASGVADPVRLVVVRSGALLAATALAAALLAGLAAALGVPAPVLGITALAGATLVPAAFLAALVFAVAVAARSASAAAGLALVLCLAEDLAHGWLTAPPLSLLYLFATTFAVPEAEWALNRATLLAAAAALLVAGARTLRRPGTAILLRGGDAG